MPRLGRKVLSEFGGGIANFTDVASTFAGLIKPLEYCVGKIEESNITISIRRAGPPIFGSLQSFSRSSLGTHHGSLRTQNLRHSYCAMYGSQKRVVEGLPHLGFMCKCKTPSVWAMTYPFNGNVKFSKGTEEALEKHPDVITFIYFYRRIIHPWSSWRHNQIRFGTPVEYWMMLLSGPYPL